MQIFFFILSSHAVRLASSPEHVGYILSVHELCIARKMPNGTYHGVMQGYSLQLNNLLSKWKPKSAKGYTLNGSTSGQFIHQNVAQDVSFSDLTMTNVSSR